MRLAHNMTCACEEGRGSLTLLSENWMPYRGVVRCWRTILLRILGNVGMGDWQTPCGLLTWAAVTPQCVVVIVGARPLMRCPRGGLSTGCL